MDTFLKVMERLRQLCTAPDRTLWVEFCDVQPGENGKKGCAKFRSCPEDVKGVDRRCWHSQAGRSSGNQWCDDQFVRQFEEESSAALLSDLVQIQPYPVVVKPNPQNSVAYSFGVVCDPCSHDPPQVGNYQQCAAPCPFYGCLTPERQESAEEWLAKEKMPPGCPYQPPARSGRKANAYARVQCYISRPEFLQVQSTVMGLHMGLYAFEYSEQFGAQKSLYYLTRSAFKNLQLSHFVYDPRFGWSVDRYEHEKSLLLQATRARLRAEEQSSELLVRVRGESGDWRGPTNLENTAQVVYSEDGEMSAYCLRFLLEEAAVGGLFAPDEVSPEDPLELSAILRRIQWPSGHVPPPWYDRADPHSRGRSLERALAPQIRGLSGHRGALVRFLGFESPLRGGDLLRSLGIMTREGLATERFWRLVRYLHRFHPSSDPDVLVHVDELLTLADRQRRSGRAPSVRVAEETWKALLSWVATGLNLTASHAPITRTGCVGHFFLRRSFEHGGEDARVPQIETCARSWLAFPILAYDPHRVKGPESPSVGFFFGTFDDSGCFDASGELDSQRLLNQIGRIRDLMHLLGTVEAQGFYVEDLVVRSEEQQGATRRDKEWLGALKASEIIAPLIKLAPTPREIIGNLTEQLRSRNEVAFGPLCLEYSALFDLPVEVWDCIAHGSEEVDASTDAEAERIRQAFNVLESRLDRFLVLLNQSRAGTCIRAWTFPPEPHGDIRPGDPQSLDAMLKVVQDELKDDAFKSRYVRIGPTGGVYHIAHEPLARVRLTVRTSVGELADLGRGFQNVPWISEPRPQVSDQNAASVRLFRDAVIPLSDMLGDLIGSVFEERKEKISSVSLVGLPPLEDGPPTSFSIGRAIVAMRIGFDPGKPPPDLLYRLQHSHTAREMRKTGIERVCDVWVIVQGLGTDPEGVRVSTGFSTEGLAASLTGAFPPTLRRAFQEDSHLQAPGIYWTFVLSWIVHP
jgi:hypothetical protein